MAARGSSGSTDQRRLRPGAACTYHSTLGHAYLMSISDLRSDVQSSLPHILRQRRLDTPRYRPQPDPEARATRTTHMRHGRGARSSLSLETRKAGKQKMSHRNRHQTYRPRTYAHALACGCGTRVSVLTMPMAYSSCEETGHRRVRVERWDWGCC